MLERITRARLLISIHQEPTVESFDNAPPSNAQQFTGIAPAALPQGFNQLPPGAREFARQYMPEDDNKDCLVSFEIVKEYKPAKSRVLREAAEAQGREPDASCEIYEDVTYIRKSVRGNDKLEVHRPSRAEDKREFPFSWQEFERGNLVADRGTSLNRLKGIDAPIIRNCHAKNVFTIEDLALVTDTWLHNLGTGARELRQQAVEYVAAHRQAPAGLELKSQLDEQKKQLEQAMELLRQQAAENEALRAQLARPKRGRPSRARAIEESLPSRA